jgi:hypothetical protein
MAAKKCMSYIKVSNAVFSSFFLSFWLGGLKQCRVASILAQMGVLQELLLTVFENNPTRKPLSWYGRVFSSFFFFVLPPPSFC